MKFIKNFFFKEPHPEYVIGNYYRVLPGIVGYAPAVYKLRSKTKEYLHFTLVKNLSNISVYMDWDLNIIHKHSIQEATCYTTKLGKVLYK